MSPCWELTKLRWKLLQVPCFLFGETIPGSWHWFHLHGMDTNPLELSNRGDRNREMDRNFQVCFCPRSQSVTVPLTTLPQPLEKSLCGFSEGMCVVLFHLCSSCHCPVTFTHHQPSLQGRPQLLFPAHCCYPESQTPPSKHQFQFQSKEPPLYDLLMHCLDLGRDIQLLLPDSGQKLFPQVPAAGACRKQYHNAKQAGSQTCSQNLTCFSARAASCLYKKRFSSIRDIRTLPSRVALQEKFCFCRKAPTAAHSCCPAVVSMPQTA